MGKKLFFDLLAEFPQNSEETETVPNIDSLLAKLDKGPSTTKHPPSLVTLDEDIKEDTSSTIAPRSDKPSQQISPLHEEAGTNSTLPIVGGVVVKYRSINAGVCKSINTADATKRWRSRQICTQWNLIQRILYRHKHPTTPQQIHSSSNVSGKNGMPQNSKISAPTGDKEHLPSPRDDLEGEDSEMSQQYIDALRLAKSLAEYEDLRSRMHASLIPIRFTKTADIRNQEECVFCDPDPCVLAMMREEALMREERLVAEEAARLKIQDSKMNSRTKSSAPREVFKFLEPPLVEVELQIHHSKV